MKFSEFIDVRDGTHSSPKPVKTGYSLVTTKNLKMNFIDFESANKISKKDYVEINKRSLVEQYDILLSMIGTVGNVYQERNLDPNYAIKNVALLKFHGDEELSNWMNYYLQSYDGKNLIFSRLSGSTQQFISLNDLRSLDIKLPTRKVMVEKVKPLRDLDKKIMLNQQVNDNLLKQLKLSFNNLYLSLTDDKTFTLGELIFENISGDWGKAQSQGDFTNRVTIIRGADIDDLALGNSAKTPIRYIKNRALVNKHLLPNDVLVEISGGSPTQSTGRSLLVSDSVIDKFSSEVLGTNFTRIFRPSSEENSILFKSYLDFLYDKDVFFNYENGTTGIKNLDYKSVLKIQLPDIRKANNYQQYINLYKLYNNTVQSNGRQSVQLTKIRQAMLNNFF